MKKVVLLAGALAAGMAVAPQVANAASTTASVAEVNAVAALDNSALYNKIVPAVNEDYHLLDVIEKAYNASRVGFKSVLDEEFGDFKTKYTEALGELTNKVEAYNNDEDGFTQAEYDECKALADKYETELTKLTADIKKKIAELEKKNYDNNVIANEALALVKNDIAKLQANDVDHPETECPSETAKAYVAAALAAANAAIKSSEDAIKALYEDGYLCIDGKFIDPEATNSLRAALNTVEDARKEFNNYADEVHNAEGNDAAFELLTLEIEEASAAWTAAWQALHNVEIPTGTGHDECYDKLLEDAEFYLNGVYQTYIKAAQDWAEDAYNREALIPINAHETVGEREEIEDMLAGMTAQILAQAQNTLEDGIEELQINDNAFNDFVAFAWDVYGDAKDATVNNEDLLGLYDQDGLHRLVDTWEPIVEEYTAKLDEIKALIDELIADATPSWHESHTFVADLEPEGFKARLDEIKGLLDEYIADFNAKIEAEKAKLENERAYRYTFEDNVADLHKLIKQGQHAMHEIEENGSYYGYTDVNEYYDEAEAVDAVFKLAAVGREVETDNASGAYLYKNMECAHSEGAYFNAFYNYKKEVKKELDEAFGGAEDYGWDYFKNEFSTYKANELLDAAEEVYWENNDSYNTVYDGYDRLDPFVSSLISDFYNESYYVNFYAYINLNNRIAYADNIFEEHLNYAEEISNLSQTIAANVAKFFVDADAAYHLTNGKTIYSDQEYFSLGFFKKADEGRGEQAEEMFETVIPNFNAADGNIALYDMTWLETEEVDPIRGEFGILMPVRNEYGFLMHQQGIGFIPNAVNPLTVGSKTNELSFELRDKENGRQEVATLAAGPVDLTFQAESLTVDGYTITRPVYVEFNVEAPEVEMADPEVNTESNKLIVRFDNPIDLTYTINSLVARTDNGTQFSYADRVINEEAGQIEFNLPEGTQTVELPEGFFTFRTGENTIARSAAMVVGVGGISTSIDALLAMGEKAQIFDLQGRRVESIVKGNTYVVNGVKVIVK